LRKLRPIAMIGMKGGGGLGKRGPLFGLRPTGKNVVFREAKAWVGEGANCLRGGPWWVFLLSRASRALTYQGRLRSLGGGKGFGVGSD